MWPVSTCRRLTALAILASLAACQSGSRPAAGGAPAMAGEPVSFVIAGLDLTGGRLKALEENLGTFAALPDPLPLGDYVRAIRAATDARRAARVGLAHARTWSGQGSLLIAPGSGVTLDARCLSAGPPSHAAPAEGEPCRPAAAEKWIRPLLAVNADLPTVQAAVWNLLAGVPFVSLPDAQKDLVAAAVPDAAARFPAPGDPSTAPSPVTDAAAQGAAMTGRATPASGSPETVRLPSGLLVRFRPAGLDRAELAVFCPPDAGAPITFDPRDYAFLPQREGVTPLVPASFPDLAEDRLAELDVAAGALRDRIAKASIRGLPWSGTPEEFYALFTGIDPETGQALPRFDRALQVAILTLSREGAAALRSLREAGRELGEDRAEFDLTVKAASGAYELFMSTGRRTPARLPVQREYRFDAAVSTSAWFLGPGATKTAPGRFRSADGRRALRHEGGLLTFALDGRHRKSRLRP